VALGVSGILGKWEWKAGMGTTYGKYLIKDIMSICRLYFTT